MVVGLLILEIHLPYAHSLKDKRQRLRMLKDVLRRRFNVAVAELDHQELWQRATVGVVTLSNDRTHLDRQLDAVRAESEKLLGGDLVETRVDYF
jgi:hypothetical protein